MFHTVDAQFMHVSVVSNHVGREFSLLFNQDIEHHSQHGEADENQGGNENL